MRPWQARKEKSQKTRKVEGRILIIIIIIIITIIIIIIIMIGLMPRGKPGKKRGNI